AFMRITLIPSYPGLQMAGIVRLHQFSWIESSAKYYLTSYVKVFTERLQVAIFGAFIGLLLVEAVIVWQLEGAIDAYYEAVTVVGGHLVFFGHRIFMIDHTISVTLLTMTSILGVVLQGIALQCALSKGEVYYKRWKKR